MNFIDKYRQEDRWYAKVLIMGIYHTVHSTKDDKWTIKNTAKDFDVSVGLVSENLRLAKAMDTNQKLINCKTRQEALKKL